MQDRHEFKPLLAQIEDSPLNPLGRTILYLVFAFIALALLWLFLAKVDIVVSSRGKVIPSGEIKILKPLESGVVSKIYIKDGDLVKKGDILMQIDPSVTDTTLKTKQENLEAVTSDIAILNALINDNNLSSAQISNLSSSQADFYYNQKEFIISKTISNSEKIRAANSKIDSQTQEIARLNALLKNEQQKELRLKSVLDLIAKKDYIQAKADVLNLKSQLDIAKHNLSQSKNELATITQDGINEIKHIKSNLAQSLLEKQKEQRELSSQINAIIFSNRAQKIVSPVDGYVGKLLMHTEGGVVNTNDTLISIVPTNAPLVIKSQVLNKDIGFLKVGQEAAIKVDTFDFQKYGLLKGDITHISNDAINDDKLGLVYEILITPKELSLNVDGEVKNLEIGMSVASEIKVGKRRVIELFIYPIIKYLDEGLSVR